MHSEKLQKWLDCIQAIRAEHMVRLVLQTFPMSRVLTPQEAAMLYKAPRTFVPDRRIRKKTPDRPRPGREAGRAGGHVKTSESMDLFDCIQARGGK